MATLESIYNLKVSATALKSRATAAIAKEAQIILAEPTNTPSHGARVVWAKGALLNADSEVEKMMWAIVGNTTIQLKGETATDEEVQSAVSSSVNLFI